MNGSRAGRASRSMKSNRERGSAAPASPRLLRVCNNNAVVENNGDAVTMQKWECQVCGYIYDPEKGDPDGGVEPGTPFDDLLTSWECPWCGATRESFRPYAG